MKNLILTLGLASALLTPAFAAPAKEYSQTAFITVTVSGEVPAAPGDLWKKVVSKDGLIKILGMEEAMGDENMGDAGSKLCGKLGGEGGNLVVTHINLESEIRYSWEPDQGGYVCHVTVKMAPSGKGSRVTVSDSYSDEKPALIAKNAADTKAHLAASLDAMKKL
jgi:hypothetical protein